MTTTLTPTSPRSLQNVPGPAPTTNPILGAMALMGYMQDMIGQLDNLFTTHGPRVRLPMGTDRVMLVLKDPDDTHDLLVREAARFHKSDDYTDPKLGMTRYLGHGLLTSDGAFWRKQRKLVAPAFHTMRIRAYADTMVRHTREHTRAWQDGHTVKVRPSMAELTLLIVADAVFRFDAHNDIDTVARAMDVFQNFSDINWLFNVLPHWTLGRVDHNMTRAVASLDAMVTRLIAQRRAEGDQGDLLSMLLAARDDDGQPMSVQQIRDEAVTLLLAGHETTANTLAWTFVLLAQNPHVQARLHAELDAVLVGGRAATFDDLRALPYTEQVIKESMRLYPAAYGVSRTAVEDATIGDVAVPLGTSATAMIYHMHRDPRWWGENANAFVPERFAPEHEDAIVKRAYLPFGAGPRVCVGNSFAMMEAVLALATIARDWALTMHPGQTVAMRPKITLVPAGDLPMTAHRRR